MKDPHVTHLLAAYIKGELDGASREKVKTHLIFCYACRSKLSDIEEGKVSGSIHSERKPKLAYQSWILPVSGVTILALVFWAISSLNHSDEQIKPLPTSDKTAVPERMTAVKTVPTPTMTPKVASTPIPQTRPVEPTPAPFSEKSGFISGIKKPSNLVISNLETWKAVWANHVADFGEKPALPPVDFNESEVVAVFAGAQPSAGYSVSIIRIENTTWNGNPARTVEYELGKPPQGAVAAAMITYPFALKVVPKIQGKTYFKIIPK